MREAAEILGSLLCGLASVGLVAFSLLVTMGHGIANEPFDLVFVVLLLLMLMLAVAFGVAAFRLGLGRWPGVKH